MCNDYGNYVDYDFAHLTDPATRPRASHSRHRNRLRRSSTFAFPRTSAMARLRGVSSITAHNGIQSEPDLPALSRQPESHTGHHTGLGDLREPRQHYVERVRDPDHVPTMKLRKGFVVAFVGIMDDRDTVLANGIPDTINAGDEDESTR